MFITSKNAIVEAISKDLVETLYIKFPISKREKDIVKLAEKKKVIIKNVDKNLLNKKKCLTFECDVCITI